MFFDFDFSLLIFIYNLISFYLMVCDFLEDLVIIGCEFRERIYEKFVWNKIYVNILEVVYVILKLGFSVY